MQNGGFQPRPLKKIEKCLPPQNPIKKVKSLIFSESLFFLFLLNVYSDIIITMTDSIILRVNIKI